MFENGAIVEIGAYEALKNSNGLFTSFIKSYFENQSNDSSSKKNTNNTFFASIQVIFMYIRVN